MARIRIEEEYIQKKEQIIMKAIDLLVEVGYESFSINKVISKAGMTKGAFFHYFSSKQELLEGLLKKIIDPIISEFEKIADNPKYSSREKIKILFNTAASMKNNTSTKELILRLLHKSENSRIMHLITIDLLRQCTPIYEKVIKEGVINGEFTIEYIHGTTFFFLHNVAILNLEIGKIIYGNVKEINKWIELKEKLLTFEIYAKSIFGLKKDINLYPEDIYHMIEAHLIVPD